MSVFQPNCAAYWLTSYGVLATNPSHTKPEQSADVQACARAPASYLIVVDLRFDSEIPAPAAAFSMASKPAFIPALCVPGRSVLTLVGTGRSSPLTSHVSGS